MKRMIAFLLTLALVAPCTALAEEQTGASLFAGGPGLAFSCSGHTMPTTGDVRPLILPIDFPDMKMTEEQRTELARNLYAENDPNQKNSRQSVKALLHRLSYGKLNIVGNPDKDILPTYTTPEDRAYYMLDNGCLDDQKWAPLLNEALAFYFDDDPERNYSDYDADRDGCIDALIVWSATQTTATATNDWGPNSGINLNDPKVKYFNLVDIIPNMMSGATISHELCHSMGLDDAYRPGRCQIPYPLEDLMSSYSSHLNVYSRYILNWLEPTVITASDPIQSVDLYSADWYGGELDDTKPRAIVLIPENQDLPVTEFYMLEYRPHTAASAEDPSQNFESLFPNQPGILIWHCDTAWDGLRFLHQDGYRLPVYRSGDTSAFTVEDFYTTGTVFSPDTTPSSDFYNDVKTGIYVEVVKADGGEYATLNVGFLDIYPPEPGNNGAIQVSDLAFADATLSWAAATDNQTAADDITYTLYRSASGQLDTVEQCEGATLVASGKNMTSCAVTELYQTVPCYFNVVATDAEGNKAAYKKIQVEHQHVYDGEWQTSDTNHWRECRCGKRSSVAGHRPTAVPAVEATCTTDGRTEGRSCSICGYILSGQTVTTPATGHDFSGDWLQDETSHWHKCANCDAVRDMTAHVEDDGTVTKEPTLETEGIRTFRCSECDCILRTEIIPKLEPEDPHIMTADDGRILRWNISDKGALSIDGDLGRDEPFIVGSYGGQGRLLSTTVIRPELAVQIDPDAAQVKLFWLDSQWRPVSPCKTVLPFLTN